MSEGTAASASGEGAGRSPARDWLPVLQDRALVPFLGWNAEHGMDRSVLELTDDAWVVFDVGGPEPGMVVRAWARAGDAGTVLAFLTPTYADPALGQAYRGWTALEDGIVHSEQVDDRVFAVPDFPAGCRVVDALLERTSRMMIRVLDVCEEYGR